MKQIKKRKTNSENLNGTFDKGLNYSDAHKVFTDEINCLIIQDYLNSHELKRLAYLVISLIHRSQPSIQLGPFSNGSLGVRCLVSSSSYCIRPTFFEEVENNSVKAIGDHGAGATAFVDLHTG